MRSPSLSNVSTSTLNPTRKASGSRPPSLFKTGIRVWSGLSIKGAITLENLASILPDTKSAMLYSLSAMTSYGHANLFLEEQWQMMGALSDFVTAKYEDFLLQ